MQKCFFVKINRYISAIGCTENIAIMTNVKKNTSIYDIAKALNVSASTVSRALQDHPRISAEVRKVVQKKAQEMNYKPNRMAVNLKLGKCNTIGVVVPNINRNFFSSAIEGIEEEAYRVGYDVLICQSQEIYDKEKKILSSLAQGKVDGVIVSIASGTRDYTHINNLEDYGIPVVLFDRTSAQVNAGSVMIDDYKGAYEVVEHLIGLGKKRIFHYAGQQHVSVWHNRYCGYLDALKEHGITPGEDWIAYGDTVQEEGIKFAQQVLAMRERPDAIFCTSDFVALGVLLEFKKAGVRIPEDIAVVGFANEPFDALITPSLTSVDQFSYTMGKMAAKMLIDRLKGEPHVNMVIQPELIVRESSAGNGRE